MNRTETDTLVVTTRLIFQLLNWRRQKSRKRRSAVSMGIDVRDGTSHYVDDCLRMTRTSPSSSSNLIDQVVPISQAFSLLCLLLVECTS